MKCLETEKLFGYAYRLLDEAAAEVRAHVAECGRCRQVMEQYGQLDAVLDDWPVAEPTPWFDARVLEAAEAQTKRRAAGGFWGFDWTRGLALAALGVLMVAGVVWLTRSHSRASNSSSGVARQSHPAPVRQAPVQMASVPAPHAGATPAKAVRDVEAASAASGDDQDAQALEDYDLAANFDVLSELPKGEPQVVN